MSSKIRSLRRSSASSVAIDVPADLDRQRVKRTLQRAVARTVEYLRGGATEAHVVPLTRDHVELLREVMLGFGAHEGGLGTAGMEVAGILCRESFGWGMSDAEAFDRMRLLGVLTRARQVASTALRRPVHAQLRDDVLALTLTLDAAAECGGVPRPIEITRKRDDVLALLRPDGQGVVWAQVGQSMASELVDEFRAFVELSKTGEAFEVPAEPDEVVLGEAG